MKLIGYLLGLSLAAAADIAPAGAQTVNFNSTAVRNLCAQPILLNGEWDKELPSGHTEQIHSLAVTTVFIAAEMGGRTYRPSNDLQADPGSSCVFEPCSDYLIRLTCRIAGVLTGVDFKRIIDK